MSEGTPLLRRARGSRAGAEAPRHTYLLPGLPEQPGMGSMARLPDSVPGPLPRQHICWGWAAPPGQGRAWRWVVNSSSADTWLPLPSPRPLRPLPPRNLAIWPRTICRVSGVL